MVEKNIFFTLTVVLMLTLLSMTVAGEENAEDQITSTIATYNIQAGMDDDGEYNLDSTEEIIRDLDADIIGLQEVDVHWGERSEYENVIKELADRLDMYYFFAPIYDEDPYSPGNSRRQYGVGVLSKHPILNAKNHEITRLSTQNPDPFPKDGPGFLEAEIHVAGEKVHFYVTHLDYRGDPFVREMQVEDTLEITAKHDNNILVGDLNAESDADELSPLFEQFNDAWVKTNDSPGYTFPAASPVKRIDYVLTSPEIDIQSSDVVNTLASDHFPVTADITLKLGSHPFDASGIKSLVQHYKEEQAFTNNDAARALKMHLTAVSHYEDTGATEKVEKHMEGFKKLLDNQRNNQLISEEAYQTLKVDANYLIEKQD